MSPVKLGLLSSKVALLLLLLLLAVAAVVGAGVGVHVWCQGLWWLEVVVVGRRLVRKVLLVLVVLVVMVAVVGEALKVAVVGLVVVWVVVQMVCLSRHSKRWGGGLGCAHLKGLPPSGVGLW